MDVFTISRIAAMPVADAIVAVVGVVGVVVVVVVLGIFKGYYLRMLSIA